MKKKTYNSKKFLLPESARSMACYHGKVMEDGIMKLTIHDCKGSIQLHNDLNDAVQIQEAVDKLEILAKGIYALQFFILRNYSKNMINENLRYSASHRNNGTGKRSSRND